MIKRQNMDIKIGVFALACLMMIQAWIATKEKRIEEKIYEQTVLRAVEYGFTKSRKGWSKEYTIERFREEIFDVVPKD